MKIKVLGINGSARWREARGLRDPKCGCSFEPFVFIECRRALPGETRANGLELVPLPLQPWV